MAVDSSMPHRDVREIRDNVGWFIGMGVGLMVLGIFSILVPLVATFAITLLVGILFIIGGIMLLYHSIRYRTSNRFITEFLLALLYAAVGLLLVLYPISGVVVLTYILTFFFLVSGVFKIAHAIRMRSSERWGWVLTSGILSLALGVLLILGMPWTAFWAIGLIVGIDLLFTGFSMVMIAVAARSQVAEGQVVCLWGQCYST